MNVNSNNNHNNRYANFNSFSNLYSNLRKRNHNPMNARKNQNNAIRENFERSLGLTPGNLNFREDPSTLSFRGPNYSNDQNFFNAIVTNKPNARKRLYKKIYG